VDVVVVVVVGAAKALLASKKLALKPATPMPSSDCRRVSGSSHHCPPVLAGSFRPSFSFIAIPSLGGAPCVDCTLGAVLSSETASGEAAAGCLGHV
jgi:hypothetical protein